MYNKKILALAVSSLRDAIFKFDKRISEDYRTNFPIYGVKRYVYAMAIDELKQLMQIDNIVAIDIFMNALEVRYGTYVKENASMEQQILGGINVLIMSKIMEALSVARK